MKHWVDCTTTTSGGTGLYLETLADRPGEVFVNVRSMAGVYHVGEISGFQDAESFNEGENYGSILKYGHRVPLPDYLDIMEDTYEGKHLIPWPDLERASGRGKSRILQLVNCGSLTGVERDGAAILSPKSIETLVEEIKEVVKPGNIEKAKQGAKARWGDKTNPSSGIKEE